MIFCKKRCIFFTKRAESFTFALVKIQDITLGQYAPRDSVIHGLDPRTKVLSSLFFMTLLLFTHRLELLLLFLGVVLSLFALSKLNVGLALRSLRPFLWLFLLTFFLHVVFTKGRTLLEVPYVGILVTEEGIQKGIFYTLRIGILIVLAGLLTLTTSPMSLTE